MHAQSAFAAFRVSGYYAMSPPTSLPDDQHQKLQQSNMPRVYPPIEGRQSSTGLSPSLVETLAGFSAGIISTLVVHPFDVVKTRLQGVSYSKHLDIWPLAKTSTTQWTRATPAIWVIQYG